MSPDEREAEALDELARAYRRLPRAEPSAELDAAILARARSAVGAPRGRGPAWLAGLATAAVLGLAVGLSWQLRDRNQFEVPPEAVVVDVTTGADAAAATAERRAAAESVAPAKPDAAPADERVSADGGVAELAKEVARKQVAPAPAPAPFARPMPEPPREIAPGSPPAVAEAIVVEEAEPFPQQAQPDASGRREDRARDLDRERDAALEERQRAAEPPAASARDETDGYTGPARKREAAAPTSKSVAAGGGERGQQAVDDAESSRVLAESPQPETAPAPPPPAGAAAPTTVTGALGATAADKLELKGRLPGRGEWLALIRRLRRDGDTDRAREELLAFRKAYPDATIPRDLRDLLPRE